MNTGSASTTRRLLLLDRECFVLVHHQTAATDLCDVKVSVVMSGHIGTSLKVQTHTDADGLNAAHRADSGLTSMGQDARNIPVPRCKRMYAERPRRFVSDAPTNAAKAAKVILDGVRADRLRILVGPDAHIIDRMVRQDPDHAHELELYDRFAAESGWHPGR